MSPEEFRREHPDLFFLDPADLPAIDTFLRSRGWLEPGESVVGARRAGDGNMNCTVRARTTGRSLILKQARPWVEKYPQFAAPWDRAIHEADFYRLVAPCAGVAGLMPRLIGEDPQARLLLLEDLGEGGDYSGVYRDPAMLGADVIRPLAGFLGALHRNFSRPGHPGAPILNRGMRELNHAHVFRIPFQPDNGLDLDRILPGLAAVGRSVADHAGLRDEIARLGREAYLADGPCLLHGDFFPGSFVRTAAGPRVIDPEFGFHGRPEWDVGVFVAHLILSGAPPGAHAAWWESYQPPPGFHRPLACQLAGVEILRRLLGYAQLPLGSDLPARRSQVGQATDWILNPPDDPKPSGIPAP